MKAYILYLAGLYLAYCVFPLWVVIGIFIATQSLYAGYKAIV